LTRRTPIFVSVILLLSVLVASCKTTPATTTTAQPTGTTTKPPTQTTTTTTAPATTTAASQAPKYGGTITIARNTDILGFDDAFQATFFTVANHLTGDELLAGDWTKGPAGSNTYSWLSNGNYAWASKAGSVAETYEIVAPGHMIFHIRHGIKFTSNQNSDAAKLVTGRELTGDDVVYTLNRTLGLPNSYWRTAAPTWVPTVKVTQVDKYTVDVTCAPAEAYNFASYLTDWGSIIPKEVVDKYGDMRDWKNNVGSGPFYLSDFVSNSSATFIKNLRYWRTDPIGPGKGNQLPYADGVKMLIIPDTSTMLSAMRTGKIDIVQSLIWDDAQNLKKNASGLVELAFTPQNPSHINMRLDKQNLPYKDLRVRQALMYATDFDTIVKEFLSGQADKQSWPITPMPDFKAAYLPLSEAPADVQDLYKYNPTKAKQLLTDAGFPNGFKSSIMFNSTGSFNADYLSIIKQMWAKVNVDLNLQPLEAVAYNNRWNARDYDDMFYGLMASSGTYRRATNYVGAGGGWNLSYVTDPKATETRDKMLTLFNSGDDAGADKANRDFMPYLLSQVWVIPTPVQKVVTYWWPWVKNYRGELSVGIINEYAENMYIWIDQDLKKQMGK
jgi:peptide/nickel transport system substrate-binding protein